MEKLIYLTHILPDITYAINIISQFMYAPTNVHMQAIEQILCYFKNNLEKGLLFTKSEDTSIDSFSDVDWAGSTDTRRYIMGNCVFLG